MRRRIGIALLTLALGAASSASPQEPDGRSRTARANGVRTVFTPVMTGGDTEAWLYIVDLGGSGDPLDVSLREFGASNTTDLVIPNNGDPVQIVRLPDFGMGTGFVSPGSDTHVVFFNQDGDTSFTPYGVSGARTGPVCNALWRTGEDVDLDVINLGTETTRATVCADDRDGGFQGCFTLNKIPGPGGVVVNLEDELGGCANGPCMARVFAEPGERLGCATWDDFGSVELFGGFADGLPGDEFFVPIGDNVAVGNLGPRGGTVEVWDLDGTMFDDGFLPSSGTDILNGPGPGGPALIFADGFESGDVSVWSSSEGAPRLAAGVAAPREGVRGVSPADGANKKAIVVFPLNSDSVPAQLGVLNMGKGKAKLTIFFRDKTGKKLGKKKVKLKRRSAALIDLPGKASGEEGSYADIKVKGKKASVWPYARLEHTGSGDVTIVPGIVIS